jgi:thiosulfate reductase cytochrome b subunit
MKIVEKHSLILRFVHWFNVPLLALMIWSGLLIYWANDIYPGFFPNWFYKSFSIDHRLAEGLSVHFFIAWFFILNGLIYLIWLMASGHWREMFPGPKTFKLLVPTILHDLGIKKGPKPPQGKFNAAQKIAYTSAVLLGILGVLSGFAIYKPVQLAWLTSLFGGYEGARLVHFVVMISFCLFIVMHVIQVIRAGWNNFRAIVAGFEVQGKNEEQNNP